MVYTQIPIARGRPPHRNRISARKDGERVIVISLTDDLAQYLGLLDHDRLRVELGSGVDHGTLRLSAAPANAQNCVTVYRDGRQISLNIRRDFLPDAIVPPRAITLPHALERDSIIIDLAPLRSNP